MSASAEAVKAALRATLALGHAIRDLGEVPEGVLYASVMGAISLSQFESMLASLERARVIERSPEHMLRWIGPTQAAGAEALVPGGS